MPPRTAKDDQPGPTGRHHISTGGEADQSVLMRTPGMMSSRLGPRKPGHSARVRVLAGVIGITADTAAGSFVDPARISPERGAGSIGFAGSKCSGVPTGVTVVAGVGRVFRAESSSKDSVPARASSNSSGVLVHRQ